MDDTQEERLARIEQRLESIEELLKKHEGRLDVHKAEIADSITRENEISTVVNGLADSMGARTTPSGRIRAGGDNTDDRLYKTKGPKYRD